MVSSCCFCGKFASGEIYTGGRLWDRVLFESPNFVVLPTVGAFIEGWLLIVPRRHYLCMAALEDNLLSELAALRRRVEPAVQRRYGHTVVFEHGPASTNNPVGCGVDHAHLHLVPTNCHLTEELRQVFPYPFNWRPVEGLQDARAFHGAGMDYLYVEPSSGQCYVGTHPNLGGQLFRRLLAAYTRQPERYDWRRFREEEKVQRTLEVMADCAAHDGCELAPVGAPRP